MLIKTSLGLNQLDLSIGKTTHSTLRDCELPKSGRQWQLGEGLAIPYAAQWCISTAKNVSIVPIYVMRHGSSLPPLEGPTKIPANHPISVTTEWSHQEIWISTHRGRPLHPRLLPAEVYKGQPNLF